MDIFTHPALLGMAIQYHELYLSFVQAGFDTDQAFALVLSAYQTSVQALCYRGSNDN